jgi:zinc transporter ZupT
MKLLLQVLSVALPTLLVAANLQVDSSSSSLASVRGGKKVLPVSSSNGLFRKNQDDEDHDHDHDEDHDEDHDDHHGIEWAGIFDTPEDSYIWIAQKVDGDYVDPTMKLAVIGVDAASEEDLESIEPVGEIAMDQDCVPLNHGETLVPSAGMCYLLTFDTSRWETTFPIDASGTDAIAFFAQHLPTEFEEDTHYLKLVPSGEDIEPVAEEAGDHDDDEESKPWGKALGASLLINLVTFAGILFAIPGVSAALKKADPDFVYAGFASFAAGAILSCAFFLLLFESTHLIASGWEEETEQIWRWGTMILLGLILPVIVEATVGHIKPDEKTPTKEVDEKEFDEEGSKPSGDKNFSQKTRLIFAICFGDFMHNLCDGFFVGAAFSNCSESLAWGITVATVLHEFPQELADYLILTGPQVGLSTMTALAINFATGLSVILGAIIVLANDVASSTTGLLLAFGGGIYLQIGCVECMPKMVNPSLSPTRKLVCIAAFIFGSVLIGLVLLDHEHCIAEGGGHDGHGH